MTPPSARSLLLAVLVATSARAQEAAPGPSPVFPPGELLRFGVFYYPEQWPREQWARDLDGIARLGFDFTHVGEFAWTQLEPSDGRFDLAWLDAVVGLAGRSGLKVVLGTPSLCPPAWMGERYPEIYLVGADGRRREHGNRANASVTNAVYLRHVDRVVERLAERYGRDPRVLGWQVDNEPLATPDYSASARAAFQQWLKARYGTIDRLNEAWGGSFWSLRYDRFDQVVLPRDDPGNEDKTSPHAVLDFRRFTADATAAFLDRQAVILRRHAGPTQWITTNYTNVSEGSDARRTRQLDFPSFTIYPVAGANRLGGQSFRYGNPTRMAEALAFHRPIAGVTGVMELQPGQVNWAPVNPLPAPGAIRMWILHALGGGASFVATYRYRHPRFGSELYHDGLVGTDGTTLTQGGREFVEAIADVRRLRAEARPDTPLPAALRSRRTALLWSHDVMWDLENHRETAHWDTWRHRSVYSAAVKSAAAPLDFVGEGDDLAGYPFVVAPAYQLVDDALLRKWRLYAERGGHLVLTCRTGQKDPRGQLPEGPWAAGVAKLLGARVRGFDTLPEGVSGTVHRGAQAHEWSTWADLLEPELGTEVLATYADQFYAGTAAAVRRSLGAGSVTYIGVETADGALERELVRDVYRRAGVAIEDLPRGAYLEWREGLWVGVNYGNEPVSFPVPKEARVLLGANPLPPAQAIVWKP
jgi:beta-galactosidase